MLSYIWVLFLRKTICLDNKAMHRYLTLEKEYIDGLAQRIESRQFNDGISPYDAEQRLKTVSNIY